MEPHASTSQFTNNTVDFEKLSNELHDEDLVAIVTDLFNNRLRDNALDVLKIGLKYLPGSNALQSLLQTYDECEPMSVDEDFLEEIDVDDNLLKNVVVDQNVCTEICDTKEEYGDNENHMIRNMYIMRFKILDMEYDVFTPKTNITYILKMHKLETCIDLAKTAFDFNMESAEPHLKQAEALMSEIINEIRDRAKDTKEKLKNKEAGNKKSTTEIEEYPDYRSIVTVKGTPEDVKMCISKAQTAFQEGDLKKAERLLAKAERICPTQNARELMKKVKAAAEKAKEPEIINKNDPKQATQVIEETTLEGKYNVEKDTKEVSENVKAADETLEIENVIEAKPMLEKEKRLGPNVILKQNSKPIAAAVSAKKEEETKNIVKAPENKYQCPIVRHEMDKQSTTVTNLEQQDLSFKEFQENKVSKISPLTIKSDINTVLASRKEEHGKPSVSLAEDIYSSELTTAETGNHRKAEPIFLDENEHDPDINWEKPRAFITAQETSNTKAQSTSKDIPENLRNAETGNISSSNISRIKMSEDYYKKAELAYKQKDFIESKRLLKLANIFFSLPNYKYMLKIIENKAKNTEERSCFENTNSEDEKLKEEISEIQRNETKKLISTEKPNYEEPEKINKETDYQTENIPKETQAIGLVKLAKEAFSEGNIQEAQMFLSTADELHPSNEVKHLLKSVDEMEELQKQCNVTATTYNDDTSQTILSENYQQAMECVKVAQLALQKRQYDKAERFLLKSQRICKNEIAATLLEEVECAKQDVESNKKHQSTVENITESHILDEKWNEYQKCMETASLAVDKDDYAKAERFLKKAIRINSTDEAVKQLDGMANIRAIKKEQLRLQENYLGLTLKAVSTKDYGLAKKHSGEGIMSVSEEYYINLFNDINLFVDSKIKGEKKKKCFKEKSHRFLDRVEDYLTKMDLEKAEALLTIAIEMHEINKRTFDVYRKFLDARVAQLKAKANRVGNDTADNLVQRALNHLQDGNCNKAEVLLRQASGLENSVLIRTLLFEVGNSKSLFSRFTGFFKKFV